MPHTGEHHSSYNDDLDILLRLRERARERAEIRHRLLDEAAATANRMNIIFLGGGEPSGPRIHASERVSYGLRRGLSYPMRRRTKMKSYPDRSESSENQSGINFTNNPG